MTRFAGAHGLGGWQWLFLFEGLPTVVIGIAAFFFLDDKVSDARWLSEPEKATIQRDLAAEQQGHHLHSIKDGLTNPRVLLLCLIYMCFTMGLYGVSFWLPSIVKASGVSNPLDIGLLSAIPYAAAAVAMVVTGRHSDSSGERRWHLSMAGVVGAAGLCASVFFAHDTALAMVALTIGTMGVMTTISQFWTLPPAMLLGGAAAAGIALANSVGSISGVISPYLIGWVQTSSGTTGAGVFGLAACMILGSLLTFTVPARLVNPQ
jgi:sugar phosphate permease